MSAPNLILSQRQLGQGNLMHFKADCHCHTYFSDGSLSPLALLTLAKEKNLTGLSITDHDTIDAYEDALPVAKQLEITLLSGIEISTEHRQTSIHVLGYGFDLNNAQLRNFCTQLQQARVLRNQEILKRLSDRKMPITEEELKQAFPYGTLGRPHIAQLMVKKGYVTSSQQAFQRFLGEKKPAYVSGFHVSVEAAIELIQNAGGFAILAHPHYIRSQRVIIELLSMPFDGIEAFYGHLPLSQEQVWINLAKRKDWMVTGGSDFHGEKKSHQSLGCAWTPPEYFDLMMKRFQDHMN